MLDRVTEITVAVYSHTADETFSERFASYSTAFLTKEVTQARIVTAKHDQPITQLRIDFSRFPVALYLDSLTVSQPNGAIVFGWSPDYDWRNNSADMIFKRTRNGMLMECTSSESSLLISVPPAISDTNLVVGFSVRGTFGTSSGDNVDTAEVWALNHLLAEQEDLSRYVTGLQRSHDDKWTKAQAELHRFKRQWTQTDESIGQINALHERQETDLAKKFSDLSEHLKSADRANSEFRSDLSQRNKTADAALTAVEKQLGTQTQAVRKATATLDALDSASKQSDLKLGAIEEKLSTLKSVDETAKRAALKLDIIERKLAPLEAVTEANQKSIEKLGLIEEKLGSQAEATQQLHHASLAAITDTGAKQLKIFEDQATELKLYIRTGINTLKRDIDSVNATSEVQRVEAALTAHHQLQLQLLENVFDSLSNIKQSRGVNIGPAARILAANYRFRGSENFSETPQDLPGAIALIGNLRNELLETRGMLETVLRSRSWHLTKPLRFVLRLAQRVFRPSPRQ